jgi:hypothetical protein
MGGEGPDLFVAHTHPLDPAFGNVVRDQVESITHDAVTMFDAGALQRLNDDLCDLLAHGNKPLWYVGRNMRPAVGSGLKGNARICLRLRRQRTIVEGVCLDDSLGAGLEPIEDLQGALASGGYNASRHSIKSRAEMSVGFWQAILFQ